MLNIRKRVLLFAADSDRIICELHRERAAFALTSGRVVVERKNAEGLIISVRLSEGTRRELENARPGSYGIRRERIAPSDRRGSTAGIVFSHQHTQERAIA